MVHALVDAANSASAADSLRFSGADVQLTQQRVEDDGVCNAIGCSVNWGGHERNRSASGRPSPSLFGRGPALIDTAQPFNVSTSFDADGTMSLALAQGRVRLRHYNSSSAGNPPGAGVPAAALAGTAQAFGGWHNARAQGRPAGMRR